MRRLLPPSRSNHDPLSGREWLGHRHGDRVSIDGYVYLFYRYDNDCFKVEVQEPDTGILWWYEPTYFLEGRTHMPEVNESVMSYTTHTPDAVTKRRQVARYAYMEAVYKRDGASECQALTKMANHWWPGTNPTMFEG